MKYSIAGLISMQLVACLLIVSGCDDTAAAVEERAAQEHADLKAQVEQLKSDMKQAQKNADERLKELQGQINESAETAKQRVKDTASETKSNVVRGVDQADKALAAEIRDEDRPK